MIGAIIESLGKEVLTYYISEGTKIASGGCHTRPKKMTRNDLIAKIVTARNKDKTTK